MAYARMMNNPNVTKEMYDANVAKLGVSNDNLPDGAMVHIAGEGPAGWRVIEVWESEEHARAWDEKLLPVLEQAGIHRPEPEGWQVHNLMQG